MEYRAPGRCPVCGHALQVSRLSCSHCDTKVEGEFAPCRFCQLPEEYRFFAEVFIRCRGNIKSVERELGISYPTVRNRLEGLIEALGFRSERSPQEAREYRNEVLSALERGEITAAEATRRLKEGKPGQRRGPEGQTE
ncbi:MAG: DUF2089 domain-containing protein [Firmicutes bacterium]|nr:DUF2089 domain-containing protein [Bacillota bacterium]